MPRWAWWALGGFGLWLLLRDKQERQAGGWTAADLERGIAVEREHDDVTHGDPELVKKIALAHLRERPDYYALLAKLEASPRTR